MNKKKPEDGDSRIDNQRVTGEERVLAS